MIGPLRSLFGRLFTDHPREVGESYIQHLTQAWTFGFRLLRLTGAALVHGAAPGLCKTTVSDGIEEMAGELGGRAEEARHTRMRDSGVWDPGL